jgi:hypothetical protein
MGKGSKKRKKNAFFEKTKQFFVILEDSVLTLVPGTNLVFKIIFLKVVASDQMQLQNFSKLFQDQK